MDDREGMFDSGMRESWRGRGLKAGYGGRGGHHSPRRQGSVQGLDLLARWVGPAFPERFQPGRTSSHGGWDQSFGFPQGKNVRESKLNPKGPDGYKLSDRARCCSMAGQRHNPSGIANTAPRLLAEEPTQSERRGGARGGFGSLSSRVISFVLQAIWGA